MKVLGPLAQRFGGSNAFRVLSRRDAANG
jgi:hypothetical protein